MTLQELLDMCRRHPNHEIYIMVGAQNKDDRMTVKRKIGHWIELGQIQDAGIAATDDLIQSLEEVHIRGKDGGSLCGSVGLPTVSRSMAFSYLEQRRQVCVECRALDY